MEPLQFAIVMSNQTSYLTEAYSALPHAPQVEYVAKPQPVRAATSKALQRLAERVAPAPSPAC